MRTLYVVFKIAWYEAKLLFRSWGFRVFALLGFLIITLLTIWIATPVIPAPYFFHSLSGSIPLFSMKLFNIFQGITAIFLSVEFLKRDRRSDTTQVIFSRSFSNAAYFIGKFLGVIGVFLLMNAALLLITALIHLFFSDTLFSWHPYLLYFVLISLPTLIFMIGISFLLVSFLRSQALVSLILFVCSFLVLLFIGTRAFFLFDIYAFYLPIIYSDFIGLGNLNQLIQLRSIYLLLGLGFLAFSILMHNRLRQSRAANIVSTLFASLCLIIAGFSGYNYIDHQQENRDFRQALKTLSREYASQPKMAVSDCRIDIEPQNSFLSGTAVLTMENRSKSPVESTVLSLNPGLKVIKIEDASAPVAFKQDNHIIQVRFGSPVPPSGSVCLTIAYAGQIDERYCYLDIGENALRQPYRIWLYNIPKRYVLISMRFLLLTPECGWYPVCGLPLSMRFPSAASRDFARFSLTVRVPSGLTAVSQGIPELRKDGERTEYRFHPRTLLPQISLTIGPYEERKLSVDGVRYALYILPHHDYFSSSLNEMADSLPQTIKQLKDEYEVMLGLDYPYEQLSLVEVPIHFFSHKRLWSLSKETVQPQMVLLPEMATLCDGADFRPITRLLQRIQRRMNIDINSKEIQTSFFSRFIRANLLGSQQGGMRNFQRGAPMASLIQSELDTEYDPQYDLFTNFISYLTPLSSSRWPILNYALESYFQSRISFTQFAFRGMSRGLSSQERTNLLLNGQSLSSLLKNRDVTSRQVHDVLQAKGRYLLAMIKARLGEEEFDSRLLDFIKQYRFQNIAEEDFLQFIESYGKLDLEPLMRNWYDESEVPGYVVEEFKISQIRDSERNRVQVELSVSNPTESDGILSISAISGGGMRGRFQRGGGGNPFDFSSTYLIPARATKDIGILLDRRPLMMVLDTLISQNIPATLSLQFGGRGPARGDALFEGEESRTYKESNFKAKEEFIVDNEDQGFEVVENGQDNWLRRTIRRLFSASKKQTTYTGVNFTNPPGNWHPAVNQNFFGRFIRSAHTIKAGTGEKKVAWNVTLRESGDYDIFFYNDGMNRMRRQFRPGQGRGQRQRPQQGEKHFIVYYGDSHDEVVIGLNDVQPGWTLIGTFRLSVGSARVEQTDENKSGLVTADAVKWVKNR